LPEPTSGQSGSINNTGTINTGEGDAVGRDKVTTTTATYHSPTATDNAWQPFAGAILSGVAGNAVYDLLKSEATNILEQRSDATPRPSPKSSFPLSSDEGKNMSKCFVIMPFSGTRDPRHDASYWDKFYQNYLKPSVEELGYICERSVATSSSIIGTIIDDLFNSDVVLAILTDFNANVLYELGVRHSLAHGTIMAIEKGQPIPFDLSQFGVVQYQEVDRAHFVQELERHIRDQRRRPVPDNPVAEHLRLKVGIARMTNNIADSPLDTAGALSSANRDVLIIGQNLYGLARNRQERDKVFEALLGKPALKVRILYADTLLSG
jgi:hypothetical protein